MIGHLVNHAPVISQAYGFIKTATKVYNATTPSGAVKAAVGGIIKVLRSVLLQ